MKILKQHKITHSISRSHSFFSFLSISKRWGTRNSSLIGNEILVGVVKRSIGLINNWTVHACRLYGNNPGLEGRILCRKRTSVTSRHGQTPLVLSKRIDLSILIISLCRTNISPSIPKHILVRQNLSSVL